MNNGLTFIIGLFTLIIITAIIAVVVNKQSQTVDVINAGSTGFAGILKTVVSPITGG